MKGQGSELTGQEFQLKTSSSQLPPQIANLSQYLHCALQAELGLLVMKCQLAPLLTALFQEFLGPVFNSWIKAPPGFSSHPETLVDLSPTLKRCSPKRLQRLTLF